VCTANREKHALGRPRQESAAPRAEGPTDYTGVYWYQLASGELRYRCWWRDIRGNQRWKRGFSSARAARRHRAAMQAEEARGYAPEARGDFATLYRSWLRSKRSVTKGTRDGYEDAFEKRLEPAFGRLRLHRLTLTVINNAVTDWDKSGEWAPKTINNTIGALSSFMSDMARRGALAHNPVRFIERVPDDDIDR
jgi:hypothetical protein